MNTFKRIAICIVLASMSTLSACVLYRGHHYDHYRGQYQERHYGRD